MQIKIIFMQKILQENVPFETQAQGMSELVYVASDIFYYYESLLV